MEDRLKNHKDELIHFYKLVKAGEHPTHASPTGITFITDEGLVTFSYELLCEFMTREMYHVLSKELEFRFRQKGYNDFLFL